MKTFTLTYNNRPVLKSGYTYYISENLGPINTWTIPSTTTDVVSYSSEDTIRLKGKVGHYETCYKAFSVEKTGTYTISYDYNLPTVNFYGTGADHMYFGIFITTNQPPGGDMATWSAYSSGNCNGYVICGPSSQNNSPGEGHAQFNYNLTAGTTYYLWVPMMNLADGVETFLTFTNLKWTDTEPVVIPDYKAKTNIYDLEILTAEHGTCVANKYSGFTDNFVSVTATPDEGWYHMGYDITGSVMTGDNFKFLTSDVELFPKFVDTTDLDFGFSGLNNNVLGYVQYTLPDLSTGELTLGTGNEGQTLITALPYGTEFSGYISANPYYRTTLNGGDTESFVISKSTAEPRKVSFSGQLTSNNWIGSQNTQINAVTWHWNFNNNNMPTWRNNNGGMSEVTMTPAIGRMTVDSCYNNESAYCIKIITDSNSGKWYGATSRSTGSRSNAYIPTNRIGSVDSNTWSAVWFSAHVNMTGGYYHSNYTWVGEGNHGQRALNGQYLINSVQLATRSTDINSTFYKGTKNSTPTTSFNLTGTGNNMPATNWNNQAIRIYAQLGAFGGTIDSDASKYPPNQVNSIYCTANCSAIFP